MTEIQHAAADVSKRLEKLLEEHGAPNTFSCSEVMPRDPLWLGRFLRKPEALKHLNRQLRSKGVEVTFSVSGKSGSAIIDVRPRSPGKWAVKTLPSGEIAVARDGHTVAVMIMGTGRAQEDAEAIVEVMNDRG